MTESGSKLYFSLVLSGICLCCLSFQFTGEWSINMKLTPSTSSRYYILNDWQSTYTDEKNVPPFPAAKISSIMLKTMGILQDGANWPGVLMGNLFSRPLATALFIVNGLSPESSFGTLSSNSFEVDQTGFTGCTCADTSMMFRGDNVVRHLNDLFDQNSQTNSVSANAMAARAASAGGSYTSEEQLNAIVTGVQSGQLSLSEYGLGDTVRKLDLTNKVDTKFIAELILIKQTIEQLKELDAYVNDMAPDTYIFIISTLESMEERYGAGSTKMDVAAELVKQVIQETNEALVMLYNGRILVQALVLEWEHPTVDEGARQQLEKAYYLLQPYLAKEVDLETFTASLPHVSFRKDYTSHISPISLCMNLKDVLRGSVFYAHCPTLPNTDDSEAKNQVRRKRSAGVVPEAVESYNSALNDTTVLSLAESRTNIFSGVFLITLFITVSLGLALYAVSWTLWNMDPGRDSIIYRQVADATVRTQ